MIALEDCVQARRAVFTAGLYWCRTTGTAGLLIAGSSLCWSSEYLTASLLQLRSDEIGVPTLGNIQVLSEQSFLVLVAVIYLFFLCAGL